MKLIDIIRSNKMYLKINYLPHPKREYLILTASSSHCVLGSSHPLGMGLTKKIKK
jgi:hypothetical protein